MQSFPRLDERLASLLGAPTQVVARQLPPRLRDELPAIPDHELLRCIGRGAYGEVWLARTVLGTCRAVKIVFRDSFSSDEPYEREFRGIQRFEPVSRSNDGLVDILQAGRHDARGCFYYVMELADDAWSSGADGSPRAGVDDADQYVPQTLATWRRASGRIPVSDCLQLGLSLTSALGHLHRHGLIHRDIKPTNIIFVQGVAKLADIGLVVEIEEALSFVGTEGFIPPEGPTSPQADLYSLGKVLYEACMGKDRKEYPEPMTGLMEVTDRDEREALLELNTIILKACAENITERYQNAEEMHVDLALVHSGKSVRWKRLVEKRLAVARKAAAVVAVLAGLATGAWLYQRHQTSEARRLQTYAEGQTAEAKRQEHIAQEMLARMQIQKAESHLQRGDSPHGLAWLAHVLRQHPDNRVAAERILAALMQRRFFRPSLPPLSHPEPVSIAHFSPDGLTLATAGTDHRIRVWNALTGAEKCQPQVHSDQIQQLIFSPDGRRVLTASRDGTACVLNSENGAPEFPPLRHGSPVLSAAFSPDGAWIATGTADASLHRFSGRTGEPAGEPLECAVGVNAVLFSPDGRLLAVATEEAQAALHSVADGELKHRFMLNGPGRHLSFSPNGKWLAAAVKNETTPESVYEDWEVVVWNVESGQTVAGPLIHDHVTSLAFSPDSMWLATADIAKRVVVWKMPGGEELFRVMHASAVRSVAFSPCGRKLLTASVDRTLRMWDALTGQAIAEPILHEGRVNHAEFSPDGARILTVGRESKAVRVWSVPPEHPAAKVLQHDGWVVSAALSADGRRAITATGGTYAIASAGTPYAFEDPQSVIVWETATATRCVAPKFPVRNEAMTVRFTGAGPLAVIRGRKHPDEFLSSGRLWDMAKGEPIGDAIEMSDGITCADISADGAKAAISSEDGIVVIVDVGTGRALIPPLTEIGPLNSVRFSADGSLLATAGVDGMARVFDVTNGNLRGGPFRHEAEVWFAQLSPNSERVLTASLDFTARIWPLDGGPVVECRHTAPIEYAEFNGDGSKLVTASGDGTARLWNAITGQPLTEEPLEHGETVVTARFSPDGLRVVTASLDGTARVWDTATGLKLGDALQHQGGVLSAAFSGDGRTVITASLDKTAALWKIPMANDPIPTWLPDLAEAVGGLRLNPDGIPESVRWSEYAALKERLSKLPATEPFADLVSRCFAE